MVEGPKTTTEEPQQVWKPPPPARIKCNTDVTWKQDANAGGIGWIARDHEGTLRWVGARKLAKADSTLEVKAEALTWAIQTLSGFGYKNVTFETNSLMLKRMITGEEALWPRMQPLMQETLILLAENHGYEVVYTSKSGNKVADRIAKETTIFASFVLKLYSLLPRWLKSCVQADKPNVSL